MKIWSFISGWRSRSAVARCVLICLPTLTYVTPLSAKDEAAQAKTDMAFIEFLGEGIIVDKEYIDPLRLAEYEQMIKDAEQEVKQQNE